MSDAKWFAALATFAIAWVAFAYVGRRKGWNGIVRHGGGFFAAWASLVLFAIISPTDEPSPPPSSADASKVQPSQVAAPEKRPGIGVTYEAVMDGLEEYFPNMEESRLDSGEARKNGRSTNSAAAILEIIGERGEEVNRASMIFISARDSPLMNLGNIAASSLFLRNVMPGWEQRNDWYVSAVNQLVDMKGDDSRNTSTVVGDRRVKLTLAPSIGMFVLVVTNKARPD